MDNEKRIYQEFDKFWGYDEPEEEQITLSDVIAESRALNPLDGRYAGVKKEFSKYFSEYAFVKNRVWVLIAWTLYLLERVDEIKVLNAYEKMDLFNLVSVYNEFSDDNFSAIKKIEAQTGNDVKAIEKFVIDKLTKAGFGRIVGYVNFGADVEDINNVAYAQMIDRALNNVWIPKVERLIKVIKDVTIKNGEIPMLVYAKGQPATSSTVGKELMVYVWRMQEAIKRIKEIRPNIKFNGLAGNYSAISLAFPNTDWLELTWEFASCYLKIKFNPVTSQVESYDYVCHLLNEMRHFSNVLKSFDKDMSFYLGLGYFKQKDAKREMQLMHQVDTVQFRHSIGNIELGNSTAYMLSDELPCACTQGDSATSTLLRSIGMVFGYSLMAIDQTIEGMRKIEVDEKAITSNLEKHWEVLIDPIQVVARKYGITDAEMQIINSANGDEISKEHIQNYIIESVVLSEEDKEMLLKLTPINYVGRASKIVEEVFQDKLK